MKFSVAVFALLSAVPYIVQGFAVPEARDNALDAVRDVPDDGFVLPRADDDWELVLFDENKKGGQCGGTSRKVSGGAAASCKNFVKSACANMKVKASVANCEFEYHVDGCDKPTKKKATVKGGKDSNGVNLNADVRFVTVSCKKN